MNFIERFSTSWKMASHMKQAGVDTQTAQRALFRFLRGYAPIPIDDNPQSYIDDGYTFNPDVYAVVKAITSSISAVPPIVYEVKDEKSYREYRRYKAQQRNRASEDYAIKSRKYREKALEEVDPESDLCKLIDRPNPLQAWPEFIENTIGFKLVTGNTYIHGVPLTDGRVGEMWNLPPQFTEIIADESFETVVKNYTINLYGHQLPIPAEDVMHLKYWNPNYSTAGSHLYGMSPLMSARRVLRAGNDNHAALSKAFSNMGASGMIFPDDPEIDSLSDKQRQQIEDFFKQKAGPENYKSALVTSAKMGWQSFGMSPVDLELIEADKMTTRKICNIYGFPSELLNDPERKTNANKKESRRQLWLDVAIPELERLYTELNRWLVPRFADKNYFLDYDVSGIEALAEDMTQKAAWLRDMWEIPPNKKLEKMNFEAVENPKFDEPWVPMNVMPLSEAVGDPGKVPSEDVSEEYE